MDMFPSIQVPLLLAIHTALMRAYWADERQPLPDDLRDECAQLAVRLKVALTGLSIAVEPWTNKP